MFKFPPPSCLSSLARWTAAPVLITALSACSNLPLPEKPVRPTVYDFGPGKPAHNTTPKGVPIALPEIDVPRSLTQSHVMYRLAYSEAQSPMPYAHAAWSMPPAQLLHQSLRASLGELHPVLRTGDGPARMVVRATLEEFSQVFTSPEQSHGLLRLRVTVYTAQPRHEQLVQQRLFEVTAAAPSSDAKGGVKALTAASNEAMKQITQWVEGLQINPVAAPQTADSKS